jgi:hypothetical protein
MSMFFFEKKNQKTFINSAPQAGTPVGKSLLASFSSEKEVLACRIWGP